MMNEPIQPNTCACPWACSHAGDMLSSVRCCEMPIRFHTPRKVPGNNIKSIPLAMKAVTRCWLHRSIRTRDLPVLWSGNGGAEVMRWPVPARAGKECRSPDEYADADPVPDRPGHDRARGTWCRHLPAANSCW